MGHARTSDTKLPGFSGKDLFPSFAKEIYLRILDRFADRCIFVQVIFRA